MEKSAPKQVWDVFGYLLMFVLWFAANFVGLALVAPALISAASTIAVVAGFSLIVFLALLDISVVFYLVKRAVQTFTQKENS